MSKLLSCFLLWLHFLSPWVTLFFCACEMQKCHGEADNSTSIFESERGKKGGSPVHVLVTEPLGSFREDVKDKSLQPIPADQPPSERKAQEHLDIYIQRTMRALMAAVYLHICHSIYIKAMAVEQTGPAQMWKALQETSFCSDSDIIALKCYYEQCLLLPTSSLLF